MLFTKFVKNFNKRSYGLEFYNYDPHLKPGIADTWQYITYGALVLCAGVSYVCFNKHYHELAEQGAQGGVPLDTEESIITKPFGWSNGKTPLLEFLFPGSRLQAQQEALWSRHGREIRKHMENEKKH